MWNCPSCSEQHEDQFDACWKCGFQLDGGRSSAGPHVEAAGHDSPSEDDFSKQPDIRLPTLTYFLIPIWIWFQIIRWLYSNPRGQPQLPTTAAGWAIEIVGLVLACFVGIPVVASMVRASYVSITRRIPGGIRMFSMFVLPQEVRARHAWFVPVYYGSIVACFVLPWAFAIWQIP